MVKWSQINVDLDQILKRGLEAKKSISQTKLPPYSARTLKTKRKFCPLDCSDTSKREEMYQPTICLTINICKSDLLSVIQTLYASSENSCFGVTLVTLASRCVSLSVFWCLFLKWSFCVRDMCDQCIGMWQERAKYIMRAQHQQLPFFFQPQSIWGSLFSLPFPTQLLRVHK